MCARTNHILALLLALQAFFECCNFVLLLVVVAACGVSLAPITMQGAAALVVKRAQYDWFHVSMDAFALQVLSRQWRRWLGGAQHWRRHRWRRPPQQHLHLLSSEHPLQHRRLAMGGPGAAAECCGRHGSVQRWHDRM